ncbi:hypothetical protein [Pseudomarimonas arenosa]|uniref:Uncharacterized protein n=1 Tax=Pseudomarimonas arenosa TaxID=2774145 RepID=A0AAW3ZQ28_9GAMM|nr:hypothetical protein [Pseudomarimonas arenosa]MBD8527828.1 hypothetical protein [Pseudomarimonas arenosa]
MEALESIRPSSHVRVIDLVEQAGHDVSDWGNFKGGPAKALVNPRYCFKDFESTVSVAGVTRRSRLGAIDPGPRPGLCPKSCYRVSGRAKAPARANPALQQASVITKPGLVSGFVLSDAGSALLFRRSVLPYPLPTTLILGIHETPRILFYR